MKFKVITLCGSTKFKEAFMRVQQELTLQGNVVISVGVFGHADAIVMPGSVKEMLDNIHKQKIDMSDEIFVINKGDYIGSSTMNEIGYAMSKGKSIRFLEENTYRHDISEFL